MYVYIFSRCSFIWGRFAWSGLVVGTVFVFDLLLTLLSMLVVVYFVCFSEVWIVELLRCT